MEPIVLETKYWRVVPAPTQAYLGRCYVTCLTPRASLSELTSEEWLDLQGVIRKLEAACKAAFGAVMFNWTCLMNNAYQHTPPDPHVHWHFRPRYDKPVNFMGITFVDENFGHHYDKEREAGYPSVTEEVLSALAAEIHTHLPR